LFRGFTLQSKSTYTVCSWGRSAWSGGGRGNRESESAAHAMSPRVCGPRPVWRGALRGHGRVPCATDCSVFVESGGASTLRVSAGAGLLVEHSILWHEVSPRMLLVPDFWRKQYRAFLPESVGIPSKIWLVLLAGPAGHSVHVSSGTGVRLLRFSLDGVSDQPSAFPTSSVGQRGRPDQRRCGGPRTQTVFLLLGNKLSLSLWWPSAQLHSALLNGEPPPSSSGANRVTTVPVFRWSPRAKARCKSSCR